MDRGKKMKAGSSVYSVVKLFLLFSVGELLMDLDKWQNFPDLLYSIRMLNNVLSM